MIILTNCLTQKADEGCLKVANSLTKRIKEQNPSTTVLSFGSAAGEADRYLKLNKLFLNGALRKLLREKEEPLLYIPFSSNTRASILRTWILSHYCKKKVSVLFALRHPMDGLSARILRWSGAEVVVLSAESYDFFRTIAPTVYLKTGVDTEKFHPVDAAEKERLRQLHGIPSDAKVVLHVGHLKEGRNLRALLDVDPEFHVVLVVSSQTAHEWDENLRKELVARNNLILIDSFAEKIEQYYQMSDVYIFPVQNAGNCIDIPLSVLEAAACGIPVVSTAYGELKEIIHQEGFYALSSQEPETLNLSLRKAFGEKKSPRSGVMAYDWNRAAEHFCGKESET